MEDDHVDRPGVEAQQCVQLTGTNSSFGLIALINQRPSIWTAIVKTISCFEPSEKQRDSIVCLSPAWWLSAKRPDPIPSRTRPSNASAPMVLCLKTRESRSPPGLPKTNIPPHQTSNVNRGPNQAAVRASNTPFTAGWSSPVARQAHNLKVAGSNPAPATIFTERRSPSGSAVFLRPAPPSSRAISIILARSPTSSISRPPSALGRKIT